MSKSMLSRFILALAPKIWAYKLWRIKIISKQKMVKGLPSINHLNQLCEGCLLGKHFRKSFPKQKTSRAKGPLDLIHADVCSPVNLSSYGKNIYFLLFIDDYNIKA